MDSKLSFDILSVTEALNSLCKEGVFVCRFHIEPVKIKAYRKYCLDLVYVGNGVQETLIHSDETVNITDYSFSEDNTVRRLMKTFYASFIQDLRTGVFERFF